MNKIMFRKLYNPLNKLVRRIKENMATFLIIIAMSVIPMGIVVLAWGSSISNDRIVFASCGIIGAGFLAWYGAYIQHKREQDRIDTEKKEQSDKEEQRFQQLIAELKGIREDLGKK